MNACYFGPGNAIDEFMAAAVTVFGRHVLLQFEDFNSNDAFPLLKATRDRFLTYNDDIQGTAAVTVAGILGGLRLRHPDAPQLAPLLKGETFLFHGAGSANLGAAALLVGSAGVDPARIFMTNSKGLIWRAALAAGAGATTAASERGNYRNEEQRRFAREGKPPFRSEALADVIAAVRPTVLVGAVGVAPGCFDRQVVEALLQAHAPSRAWLERWAMAGPPPRAAGGGNDGRGGAAVDRPIVFALSNPKTQAELTAEDAYGWSDGRLIFGSGTSFEPVAVDGRVRAPGQVNNVYIFPGLSFGAAMCRATTLPDEVFLLAAEAVARALSAAELAEDRVVPHPARLREVGLSVATATVLGCQRLGLATRRLGEDEASVRAALSGMMWLPNTKGQSEAAKSRL